MKIIKNIRPHVLLAPGLVLLLMFPAKAFAQCESPGDAATEAGKVTVSQAAAVEAMTKALKEAYEADVNTAKEDLLASLETMDKTIIGKLDWWWEQLYPALQEMAKQLNAGFIDQSRQRESNEDASNVSVATRQEQRMELEAKKLYQPTNQACQFDTTARYLGRSANVSKAVTTGYTLDFNKIGNGDKDSPAAGGPETLQKARWEVYQSKFCDSKSNNGAAGCSTSAAMANMDVLPSKTIFAKETIDMTDADTRDAVSQLLFNITGYETPDLIPEKALKSSIGLQQRQENREYIAQMDAGSGLAAAVVADRVPGAEATEIQAIRRKMGLSVTYASPTPSNREIRQAIIEQLWDPNYYLELFDSPATLTQKELYLKAYSLVMLYDIIAKQERISTVYAIETANMLDQQDHSRHGAPSSAPFK
jgi:hypothetical protein